MDSSLLEYDPAAGLWPVPAASTAARQDRPVLRSVHCLIQVELSCFRVRPPQSLADRLVRLKEAQVSHTADVSSFVNYCSADVVRCKLMRNVTETLFRYRVVGIVFN